MSRNELKSLPSDTVRLIGSSQVIASIFSIVKELVENSIDADANSVEVKLDDSGFDKVEIRDNGHGINSIDIPLVAKRHHTSKIRSFNNLSYLSTYGFRGEALGSLCAVSSLSITTKSPEEDVSHSYSFDFNGNVLTCLLSHLGQGTTVEAMCIFKNVPVRRQFYKNEKRKKKEIKKIEDLLMAYGVIRPELQLILKNNKNIIWQKCSMANTKNVLLGILGNRTVANLEQMFVDNSNLQIMAFLPKSDADPSLTSRSTNDRCFVAVNKRPVQLKDIEKLVQWYYGKCTGREGRFPVFVLHVVLPSTELDVNVDANKTLVRISQQVDIKKTISLLLESLYGPLESPTEGLRQDQCSKSDGISLIGPLKYYNGWVCYHDNKLKILNPYRVEEVLLYKELMDNHIIPSARLEHSIGITPSNIGEDLYIQLVDLVPKCAAQTYTYIDDKRLKANGIEVQCHLDIDCHAVMEIVGLATCMPMYGIKDLQEVLEQIVHNNATTVYQSWPLKVIFYLQGETVRMIRHCPVNKTRDEMLELIQQISSNCVKCLHEKPLMHLLYDMVNIPCVQSPS